MFNIFLHTVKERRWTIIVYCVSIVLFLWMYISLFPSLQKSIGALEEYMKNFPEGFMKAFGFEIDSFSTFEGYLASEQFSFIWPFFVIALLISLGSSFFSGEIEKGTIELLLSQPISRVKIFLGKFFAGVFNLAVFVFISFIAIFPMAEFYNIQYKTREFLKLSLIGFLFGLSVFGISLLASVIFSERSKAIFLVVGILVFMYVLNIVSGLKENLEKLKYFSFFYYFNPPNVLLHNKIDNLTWWVFSGVFIITSTLALFWFRKKDVII